MSTSGSGVAPGRRIARGLVVSLALAAALASCAKKAPPSGGPPDLEPPRVIESSPDSGAANVARAAHLSITFSEGMEPRSTGDAISLAPRVDIRQRRWSGRTITVVLAETLRTAQTYTLFVGSGARDRHGNNLSLGRSIVFTTAPSFPAGAIAGSIEAKGFTAPGTYLWCYHEGRSPDSTARDFDALGLADAQGQFRISGLPVPGRYHLWAFADLNQNRSFEPDADVLAPADTTFVLDADHPVAKDVKIAAVNPRAPARVRGAVLDSLAGDTLGVVRLIAISVTDSTRHVRADADLRGGFDLSLAAGEWTLRAFRDFDKNRLWDATKEPASEAHPLHLTPADDIQGVLLVLQRPPEKRE